MMSTPYKSIPKARPQSERFTLFFFFRPTRKDLLDSEELAPDRVYLPIAAIIWEISLSEDGVPPAIHFRQFSTRPDDPNIMSACSLVRLNDEWAQFQQRKQLIGVRRDVRFRSGYASGP